MMAETVDDITIEYKEGEELLVEEIEKIIIARGTWPTIIFKYRDWNQAKQEFGPEKFSIRRYQKYKGEYKAKSKFNITNVEQAKKMIEALSQWVE